MSGKPTAKRQRTASSSTASAVVPPPPPPPAPAPSLTIDEIRRLPLYACHHIIHQILQINPEHAAAIRLLVPPPPPPRPMDRPPLNLNHYFNQFEYIIDSYHPYKKISDASEKALEDLAGFIAGIQSDCEESDHYETRLSAFSALTKMGQAMSETGNEQLTHCMLLDGGADLLVEALSELLEMIEDKGELERLKADGMKREVRTLNMMFHDRGVQDDAFQELADDLGIVSGESSDEDE